MPLQEYARKRNFKKTPEPGIEKTEKSSGRFVIQKHAASHLHYDFRLEWKGVLKSWAVPKGMPYKKGEKRLAIQVEDHPVSYIHFEGVIPEGQYGGGTVMLWDRGTFSVVGESLEKEFKKGKLSLHLKGEKLNGEWHLVRLKDSSQWLLIKADKNMKPVSVKEDDHSVLSHKTMKALSQSTKIWDSSRKSTKLQKIKASATLRSSSKKTVRFPKFIEPMKALLVEDAPAEGWEYELKFDGYRALAFLQQKKISLLSRNQKYLGEKFGEIQEALSSLPIKDAIIDGEIVALDSEGRPSFQLLQSYLLKDEKPPIYYYAFDLLRLNGKDLTKLPLSERKALLEEVIQKAPEIIRYSGNLGKNVKELLHQAKKRGLEGLIGKRQESLYESGRRSGSWIKLKLHQEQEFVIGGFTEPAGSRRYFGALLVGVYKNKKLHFTGKVGTGFDHKLLKFLHHHFVRLIQVQCPFLNLPEKKESRYGQAITASQMRKCHWITPELVCQVRFSEWTRDEKLRQPVFLGLREDKSFEKVIREKAV
ncbi:MAG: non-homologous end-joining DNA ligase [Verrucomicrobiota bacterium]